MNTIIILFVIALLFSKDAAAGPAALMALAGGAGGGGAPPAPGNNGHCDQVVIVRPPKKKPMEPIVIQQPSPYQPQPIYMAPPLPPPLPPGYPAGYPPPGYPLIPRYPRYDFPQPQQQPQSSYPSPPQYEQPASYPTPPQQPYIQPRIDFGYRGQVNGGGPPPPWLYPYTQFFTQKTYDNGHREKHEHNNLDVLSPKHVLQIFIPLSSEYQESLNNKLSNGVSVPPRLEMADLQQQ